MTPLDSAGFIQPVNVEAAAKAIMAVMEARYRGVDWSWNDMSDEAKAERLEEAEAALLAGLVGWMGMLLLLTLFTTLG